MVKYSFYNSKKNSNCTEEDVLVFLSTTDKPIKYTFGYKYRHPTTYEVPITADKAIECFKNHMTDVTEYEDWVDVNSYSGNDMW